MVRLTILGDVDLKAEDGTVIGSVLSQPRRFALLVYLALESRGAGVQRDRLLGVFWPELPQDNARQSLRTALHFLRRSLGRYAIVSNGDLLAIDDDHISCDAADLRAALDAGDAAEALRLYDGDLLPGFYIDGGPIEFERWLDETRDGIRRATSEAAWSLAEQSEEKGNHAGAGAWARKAAALSEDDEAAVRRAIGLLGRIGDRAGALAAYDDLARRLETEYDAGPSAETEAAIARVRAAEAPAAHESEAADPLPVDTPTAEPTPAPATTAAGDEQSAEPVGLAASVRSSWTTARRRPLRTLASTAVTVTLMFAFYSLWGLNRVDPAWTKPHDLRPVIQVEEIRDFSTDAAATDLAGVLSMELAGRLSETDGLLVVSVASGDSARSADLPSPTYILRGGLLRSDTTARVTAMIVDAASGATLERITAERALAGDPAATVDELVEALGLEVRREIGRAVDDYRRSVVAKDSRALELVRAGLHDLEAADSLSYAGASEAARVAFAAADSQLARAQAAAPRWPEPSVQRAEVALRRMWLHLMPPRNIDSLTATIEDGIRHAQAALSIAPKDPAALELAGSLHHWLWVLGSGGADARNEAGRRAEDYLSRATSIDPSLARGWDRLSALQEAKGHFAAANLSARRAYRADAYLENVHNVLVRLFTTSLEIGDEDAAREWCGEIKRRSTGPLLPGYCRLELLAWDGGQDGVGLDSVEALIEGATPEGPNAAHWRPLLNMLGAVVLARGGHNEDAQSLMDRSLAGGSDDVLRGLYQAWAYHSVGQRAAAAAVLDDAAAKHPLHSQRLLRSARFESLLDGERARANVAAR